MYEEKKQQQQPTNKLLVRYFNRNGMHTSCAQFYHRFRFNFCSFISFFCISDCRMFIQQNVNGVN